MKHQLLHALCAGLAAMCVSSAGAFEASQVRIIRIESANFAGHTWVSMNR